ncbi:Uncharacterised protein [Mycobacterium tuberculosis]|nr:Uncharacterised protein [Mycobacterium tuberculosis]
MSVAYAGTTPSLSANCTWAVTYETRPAVPAHDAAAEGAGGVGREPHTVGELMRADRGAWAATTPVSESLADQFDRVGAW